MKERQIDDVQDLATEIANHAFEKHKLEFQNKHLGPEIKIDTKEDFEKHVVSTLESSQTKCFKVEDGFEKGTCYFYNKETNTFIVVPGEKSIEPTCFRPKDFERKLDAKIEKTRDKKGNEPELKNSIYDLLPELKKEAHLEHKPENLTWYEVQQKRAALHKQAESQQEQQRAPQPDRAKERYGDFDKPRPEAEKVNTTSAHAERVQRRYEAMMRSQRENNRDFDYTRDRSNERDS